MTRFVKFSGPPEIIRSTFVIDPAGDALALSVVVPDTVAPFEGITTAVEIDTLTFWVRGGDVDGEYAASPL